jgi:hypothetical protein
VTDRWSGVVLSLLFAWIGAVYLTVGPLTWPVGHVACWRSSRRWEAVAGGVMVFMLLFRAASVFGSMWWGSLAEASDAARDSGWVAIATFVFSAAAFSVAWSAVVRRPVR